FDDCDLINFDEEEHNKQLNETRRRLLRQQTRQRLIEEEQHRRAIFAAENANPAYHSSSQTLSLQYLELLTAFSDDLSNCNLLSMTHLSPISSLPCSLLYHSHPSLPPYFIDYEHPYAAAGYRCVEYWWDGSYDGAFMEMMDGSRDEEATAEAVMTEITAEIQTLRLKIQE